MTEQSISITMTGSGGSGVMTAGNMLLDAAGRSGLFGIMTRSAGPQIRGGEAAAMLRLSNRPIQSHKDQFDILLGIDWKNADLFASEIVLDSNSITIGETGIPQAFTENAGRHYDLSVAEIAKQVPGGRANMVALGVAAKLISIPLSAIKEVLTKSLLKQKGEAAVKSSLEAVEAGMAAATALPAMNAPLANPEVAANNWSITGNEACGMGAIRGGIRFVAAYPITPATEVLEWLADNLPKMGGKLVQAEDELASVNQAIGASFGGVPSLTATSGPGIALMTESLGLSVASETPIVVIDVMRGGPSTGIPAKSEQSDLNIAVFGLHGDAPHIVTAPLTIADCLLTTQWSVYLAEKLQAPAIVLSDQALGQTRAVIPSVPDAGFVPERMIAVNPDETYRRYADTESGVSEMSLPGTANGQYTADGLEHALTGLPSSKAEDHHLQMNKRLRKIKGFDFGENWAEASGDEDAEIAVLTWGSSYGAISQAVEELRETGQKIRLIGVRLITPAQPERMKELLKNVKKVLVIEQNHSGQFYHFLKAFYDLDVKIDSIAIPGPLPILPAQVRQYLKDWSPK